MNSRCSVLLLLAAIVAGLAGCTAAFGPGYVVDQQEIHVDFSPGPEPRMTIDAVYKLRNTGNQPLSLIELRLPGRRRFHFADPSAQWDGAPAAFEASPANPRNVQLAFAKPWSIGATHTLRLTVTYQPASGDPNALSFTPDAFFLPAEGWSPELLPARGLLATGGIPPKLWSMTVRVPRDFLLHANGHPGKSSNSGADRTTRFTQRSEDGYPFVIAGRYRVTRFPAGKETVNLWTRAPQDSAGLREPARELVRAIQAYDYMFGTRGKKPSPDLWIVECPIVAGCFSSSASNYAQLISQHAQEPSAEMASLDSVLIDLGSGVPQIAAAAAPSLASSWLGYGQNPGFYEQDPPLSALPAFAASEGREAVEGPQVRPEIIRRALLAIPPRSAGKPDDPAVLRAKSLLFFYGLQDRYGQEAFRNALSHMLYARRGGGFDLADLISAFEEETHQNVAQFVRVWMKHPGVPDEFRAHYENERAALTVSKENTQ